MSAAARHGTPGPGRSGPLAGLRVVDMATMMAAPWAATFLADYGADVIKVEHPTRGDHARQFGLSKDGEPVFWKTLARNKRSLCLDVKTDAGREAARQIARRHEVLREFFADVLAVDDEAADRAACGMEHHMGRSVLRRLACLAEFVGPGAPRGRRRWLDEFHAFCCERERATGLEGRR